MSAISYPRSSIPVVPVFSWAALIASGKTDTSSIDDVPHTLYTSSGAAAIALALRHAGIGAGHEVLLPAYHCRSMVEPVSALFAQPVFYKVCPDLAVDLRDLEAGIGKATRAVLVTHYFGFPQDMAAIRLLCDRHGVVLIEDCAHAFFGTVQGRSVGAHGDYAIASARKFFPIHDGGCLVSAQRDVERMQLRPVGLMFQLKAGMNILEEAFTYGRARITFALFALPLRLKDLLWRIFKRTAARASPASVGPEPDGGFRYFAAAWMDRRMSLPSRLLMAICPRARIVARRRRYYQRLVAGLSGLPNARPLHQELPQEVVPYMLPFIVDRPDTVFPALKNRGVPIYRWEDLATSTCSVSNDYSHRLLQLPCHPELREKEVDWIIERVRAVLSDANVHANLSVSGMGLEGAR